ncbi:MAG: hypothetical protein ABIU77_16675, partial [Ferruginibacter sp.]
MKRISYIIALYVLTSYPFTANAQNINFDTMREKLRYEKEDTGKVNLLNELSRKFNELAYYDSGTKYSTNALSLAKKINFEKGKADAQINFTWTYYNRKNVFDSSLVLGYLRNALMLFEETGDKKSIANSYVIFGRMYFSFQQDFPKATEYFFKALKQYEAINDKSGIANCFQLLGLMYINNDNFQKGYKYTLDALTIYEGLRDSLNIAYLNIYLGVIYSGLYSGSDHNKALKSCSRGLQIYSILGNRGPLF